MTTATCTSCHAPARWRDADGQTFCGSHVPANGKPLARLPAPPIDIVDALDDMAWIWRNGADGDTIAAAAAEIRRLRALVEAAGDKSGAC
jgi:hypothetical protein